MASGEKVAGWGLAPALSSDLIAKFNRYCINDSNDAKLLNYAGMKYLLKSCPGLTISDEEVLELLGGDKRRKLPFDAFLTQLGRIASSRQRPGADPVASLLVLVLESIVPNRLEEPEFAAAHREASAALAGGSVLSPPFPARTMSPVPVPAPGSYSAPYSRSPVKPPSLALDSPVPAGPLTTRRSPAPPPATAKLAPRGPEAAALFALLASLRLEAYLPALEAFGVECVAVSAAS
jgi:hypothetical protein